MVSIIIVNYNTFSLTADCIHSVLAKVKGSEYEIILVDNASVECSPDLFVEKFPEIKLVKSTRNLGFAGGNNLGITQSNGEYILLLNSDTILENDAVSLTANEMKNRNIQLSTCNVLNEDNSHQTVCSYFPSARISFLGFLGIIQLARKLGWQKLYYEYGYKAARKVDWIWGCFFLFKKEILDQFPEKKLPDDFFMYGEDMQWCYLLKKKGIDSWYLPGGIITHLFSGNKSSQDPSVNTGIRNYIIFLKRYYGWWRYSLIFLFDTLTALTRLRWKYLGKKIKLFFTLQ